MPNQLLPLFCLLALLCYSCNTPSPNSTQAKTIELSALADFMPVTNETYAPAYRHQEKNALAIDAAKYKDRFALAETTFSGPAGEYRLELTTLGETDGESTYEIFVDGQRVATLTNEPTAVDYAAQIHQVAAVSLRPQQTIGVAFNSSSNGKIPEGDGFAFSRGRWTGLRFIPLP